ncbi:MAG: hypothetical protein LQ337_003806 [Flavoplaca oasis]|nr:MAG: hypothetical protein LQ337_003806 [Flavoplaca oasis]
MAFSNQKHIAGGLDSVQRHARLRRSSTSTHSPGSSTETILHHPSESRRKEFLPAARFGLRRADTNESASSRTSSNQSNQSHKVIEITSCLKQVLGFPSIDAPQTHFDARLTQTPHWKTPKDIQKALEYQKGRHQAVLPRDRSVENQRPQDRIFDPHKGAVYSGCTQCDPAGGPTDCQHPEDPSKYSTELNPIPKGDPAFRRCGPVQSLPVAPEKTSPGRLISKPLTSQAVVSPETALSEACRPLLDEMLAARHLSNFLTENVELGIATSYIPSIFTTHGTLLGYSSPLPVTTARNIAAITGTTWRVNDSALLRGTDVKPVTGSASLLKVLETTQAEKGPGLFNMICEYKKHLMSVQWIKPGLLLTTMVELDEQSAADGIGKFSIGAGDSEQEGDAGWEDHDNPTEETTENDEVEEEHHANTLPKKMKLFQKSQAVASALREQWKVDDFKLPPGFR